MKKFAGLSIFVVIVLTASAQDTQYPFEVKTSGKGNQSMILIPGFACSGDVWDQTRTFYENDYICYTLTMAGFAGVAPQSKPTFKSWEKAIATFISKNKINKPLIIGHSMGGGLAMALASDYPELISKIIVVDALPCVATLMDPSFKAKENNDCNALIAQITSATNEQFYQMQKNTIPRLLADTSKQELVLSWSVKSDRTTFAEMYRDFSTTDLREKIAGIKCPALVLLESYFANFKPSVNEQFKNLTSANLQYATKGLHFIMYDDKEWYNEQISTFINQ